MNSQHGSLKHSYHNIRLLIPSLYHSHRFVFFVVMSVINSKHRFIRIVFLGLLVCLLFLNTKYEVPVWIYALLVLSYLLLLFYGSYFVQSNFFVKALCNGSRSEKTIALSFDDGPMRNFTPTLLDILKSENVPATFFLIGKNISGNEDLVNRMLAEGHVIGNHSYSHTYWFSLNKSETIYADLKKCDEEILRVAGKRPKFFRPPYGVTNPMVAKATTQGNYQCIGWSIRTYDTNAKSADALLKKSLHNLQGGDIILFHDWGAHTIGIISDFIKEARARGFTFVTTDKLLGVDAYYH